MSNISYHQGDILTAKALVTAHQVNCRGVMGKGLAKQVARRYPSVYQAYRVKCLSGHAKLGDVQLCRVRDNDEDEPKTIANCFSQDGYGSGRCYTDYEALRKCLLHIRNCFNGHTIALPYGMGCGLAGGDWQVVSSMINEVFEDISFTGRCELWKYEGTV